MVSSAKPTPEQLALVQGLFIQNLTALRGFVLSLVGGFDLVDDVIQETFITVSAKASDFRPGTNFRAWVSTIAKFKVLQALDVRSRRDTERLSPEVVEALCAQDNGEDLCAERQLLLLTSCLQELAPKARRILDLRYQDSQRPPEIARLMGWTVDAVHVALSRTREFLRNCLKRRMGTETG